MERKSGRSCLLLAGVVMAVLLIPLALVAYWTLFLAVDDSAMDQTAARVLAAAELTDQVPRLPIIIVHGLWDGDADQVSDCAATDGPFAYETLLAAHRYLPLHDIGPWLIEDGYAPYYVILATAPDHTPPLEENGRCLEQQLGNLMARLGADAPEKFIIIAHSMGGLVTRACLAQSAFCRSVTERLITLGSPHNGTNRTLGLKTGEPDCAADPGLCQMVDHARTRAFNAKAPNLPGIQYTFIGGTEGIFQRLLFHENDGLVGAWSAVGMLFDAAGQPQWAAWTQPNPPTIYFVTNKHAVSRRRGFAYSEAPAPGQISEAYACIRYALGKTTERPAVCRTPAATSPAILRLGPQVVDNQ
ncbi:MAG: esterase/lipase family protein [Caldilineaceae bacterium]